MTRAERSPGVRVLLFSAALAGAAGLVFVTLLAGAGPVTDAGLRYAPLLLAVLFVVSELMVVHVAVRREAYTVSLSEVPLVMGLALVAPGGLVVARLIGAGATMLLVRRLPLKKLLFNLSMFTAETVLAIVVYRAVLGGDTVVSLRGIAASIVATLVAGVFNTLCVTVVIWLAAGSTGSLASIGRALGAVLATTVVNGAVGIGVIAAVVHDPWLAVPLAVGVLLLYLLYRAYVTLSHRYEELGALHVFTERVTSSLELDVTTRAILGSARQLLRCEQAWLLVPSRTGEPRLLVDTGTDAHERRMRQQQADELVAALVPDGLARVADPKALPEPFAGPYKDLVAAPMLFDGATGGLIVAANRLTQVSTFDAKDVPLLETLANQAAVALQNGRLFDRLRTEAEIRTHQALHDSLTGLPNRTQLDERFREALDGARAAATRVGVLIVDLDGFKDVNDTLGHQTGDDVLCLVCRRMEDHLPDGAMLARFGGDEFVVLLPTIEDETAAMAVGTDLLQGLSAPFRLDDLTLAVGARAGVAVYPEHGADPATLLQHADVAMYKAKVATSGVAVYAAEDDPFTPQRLALAGELREAIGRGEIEVLYQPIVSLKSGAVVNAEALVRWRHPERGLLGAGAFVPIAERTGMIHALTLHVLERSLQECRSWRDHGDDITISVNLSMQDLLDTRLPGDIVDLLVKTGVPASSLMLELTESMAMTEVRRTLGVLTQLHELGLRLAIDDFGTGYSSLAYLRRLPVSELKIDRTFVHSLAIDDPGAAIVATVIELGHQLGLQVVAEGVETNDVLERLGVLGSDLAQGYVISPPRSGASFADWLRRRAAAEVAPLAIVARAS